MSLPLPPGKPIPTARSHQPSYPIIDPKTDIRLLLIGGEWLVPAPPGYPMRTTSGDWMIPVIVELPYAMLVSVEAEAQSRKIGNVVRAALVTAGHGTVDDIIGIKSDRYATFDEQKKITAAARSC